MIAFAHEISYPKNITGIDYLWGDYFHDYIILSIASPRLNGSTMTDTLIVTFDGKFGGRSNDEANGYTIEFHQCKYYHCERQPFTSTYISGRFLDTALLSDISKMYRRRYYQFRIYTDAGYMDFICKDIIVKRHGEIAPAREEVYKENVHITYWRNYEQGKYLSDDKKRLNGRAIKDLAVSEDVEEKYFAMAYIALTKDKQGIHLARTILLGSRNDNECYDLYDIKVPAIWILGRMGDEGDVALLNEMLSRVDDRLSANRLCFGWVFQYHRFIEDAIEHLIRRLGQR